MRYAIVSDIHANWQAWTAVRNDILIQNVDCSLCLGDIIGYGPQPQRVLDDVRQHCHNFVLGNHDAVVCGKIDPALFNDNARFVIDWTCQQLGDESAAFFDGVSMLMGDNSMLCAHAEVAMPSRWSYIFEAEQSRPSFEASSAELMFVGHTHKPLVCRYRQGELDGIIGSGSQSLEADHRYLINVGSVGDPRDGLPTASYCIFDDEQRSVEFRRLTFDYAAFRDDLEHSRLPVRPMFLDCIGDVSSANTQIMPAPDMAMEQTTSTIPAASAHETHTVKIRMQKRKKVRARTRSRVAVPIEAMAPVEKPANGRGAIVIATVVLLFLLAGLVGVLVNRGKAPLAETAISSGVAQAPKSTANQLPGRLLPGRLVPGGAPATSVLERPARYLRIAVIGGACSLAEVEVYAHNGEENLAFGKKATQSSTRASRVAGLAVDGRVVTLSGGESMAHTHVEGDSWWELDLGRETLVGAVRLWGRSDGEYDEMNGYSIQLKDGGGAVLWERAGQKAPVPDLGTFAVFYPSGRRFGLPLVRNESIAAAKVERRTVLDLAALKKMLVPTKVDDWLEATIPVKMTGQVHREVRDGIYAMAFDGRSSLSIEDADSAEVGSAVTVAALVCFRNVGTQKNGFGGIITRDDDSWRLMFKDHGATIHWAFQRGRFSKTIDFPAAAVNDGKWHHIAGVISLRNQYMGLYVDGELAGEVTFKNGKLAPDSSPIVIGAGAEDGGREFDGWISLAVLMDVAANKAQIREMATRALAGVTKPTLSAGVGDHQDFGIVDDGLLAYDGFRDDGDGWARTGWTRVKGGLHLTTVDGPLPDRPAAIASAGSYARITPDSRYGRPLDMTVEGPFGKAGMLNEKGHVGADGTTVYLSCLIRSPADRFFEFELHRGHLDDAGRIAGIGNDAGPTGYYLRAGDRLDLALGGKPNKTQFMVMRIDYKAGMDDVRIYRSPAIGEEPRQATLEYLGQADMSFDGISFGAFGPGGFIELDEIRIGITYEAVTPASAVTAGITPTVGASSIAAVPSVSTKSTVTNSGLPVVLSSEDSQRFKLSGKGPYLVYVKFRTTVGGMLFSSIPSDGWGAGSRAIFVENGTVQYEIAGTGRAGGGQRLNDGEWHSLSVKMNTSKVIKMYVDGELISERPSSGGHSAKETVAAIGRATEVASAFQGEIATVCYFAGSFRENLAKQLTEKNIEAYAEQLAYRWTAGKQLHDKPDGGRRPPDKAAKVFPMTEGDLPAGEAVQVASVEDVARALLKKDWAGAKALAAGDAKTLGIIERALGGRARLIQSFTDQIGTEPAIKFSTGLEVVQIRSVQGTTVEGAVRAVGAVRLKTFDIMQLPLSEKVQRLGIADPATPLYYGLMQSAKGDIPGAVKYFERSRSDLGRALVSQAKEAYGERKEALAEKGLVAVLGILDVDCSSKDYDSLMEAAHLKPYEETARSSFLSRAVDYLTRYDSTEFGAKYVASLEVLMTVVKSGRLPGLFGEYYLGNFKGEPVATRVDATIHFDWGRGKPIEGVRADNFTVRWTGFFVVPESGEYSFEMNVDDQLKMWLDDEVVGNKIKLLFEAGKAYPLRIEYRENTGAARAIVKGAFAGKPYEKIPRSYFYHTPK